MTRFLDWLYCKRKGNPSRFCECDMYWGCVELQSSASLPSSDETGDKNE